MSKSCESLIHQCLRHFNLHSKACQIVFVTQFNGAQGYNISCTMCSQDWLNLNFKGRPVLLAGKLLRNPSASSYRQPVILQKPLDTIVRKFEYTSIAA